MPERPLDVDVRQSFRDIFLTKNEYKLVDDFVIRDGNTHPVALLVPGGGYGMVCSFIEGVPIARKLNEKGISAFILYYHVRNKAEYPAPMDDLARAVREIMEKKEVYNIDFEDYSIWGASAGGHLAASFGTDNVGYVKYGLPKPAALILAYPVISMDLAITHGGSHDNLLGKKASPEKEEMLSVEKHVHSGYPDTYLWCSLADKVVDPLNSRRMARALAEKGIRYQLRIFDDTAHGVGPGTGTNAEGWIDEAIRFWLMEESIR
ncbi:MAG: alpha/beta hydrolase [Erysipelotrichaceae bacterium]|nr:alpha/beta hydrolase [Erysipelotrichaceae bacterium]